MYGDAMDLGRGQHPLELRHHPGEGGQGAERRLLGGEIVGGGAEQPAAAGIKETWLWLIRRQRRQQPVQQAAIEAAHVGVEIAGHMNQRVERRQRCDPGFG